MTTKSINTLAREIRVSDAIVVMGAGVSFAAGMPLAGQLSPLIWHALDLNPDVLKNVCSDLRILFGAAKKVIADDPVKISQALSYIKTNESALSCFKRSFCDLDNSRSGILSAAHTALARLVHARRVVEVISFNWDTLLEQAFRRQFGFEINGQSTTLWKPHGDCNIPDSEWVLPNEGGKVPAELVDHLTKLASARPRILIIIGYAERDEAVVRNLIAPLANRWRVFRVGPSATGEGAIPSTAAEALKERNGPHNSDQWLS